MSDAELAQAIVLRASDRPLFGLHNAPHGPNQRAVGIVLCNPVGYEALSIYRTYRHLAEALAEHGFHVLRFDWYGTGDSAAASELAGRCAEDVAAAIEGLKARTGVGSVCLLGVRAGALLALLAATARDDLASLALWATPSSGRAHVRELIAFQRLSDPQSGDDELRIAGFLLSDAVVDELRGIDPVRCLASRAPLNVLLLSRDDLPRDGKLADAFRSAGHTVASASAPGYAEMMTLAEASVVPFAAIALLCDWAVLTHAALEPLCAPPVTTMEWFAAEPDVLEAGVRFGPHGRLFGVLSAPAMAPERAPRAAVVIANTGANHHIGNGRLGVTFARSLARQGISVLRFDAAGIGESRALPGRTENLLYAHDASFDICEAMRFLQAQRHVEGFVLLGVCAGAYMALRSALLEPRVIGQVLVNLAIFEPAAAAAFASGMGASFKSRRVYVEALLDLNTWRRLFEGRVAVVPILTHLVRQAVRQVSSATRSRLDAVFSADAPTDPVELDFRTLGRRGTRTLMVYGTDDASLDALAIVLGDHAERLRRDPNFDFQLVTDADHAFTRTGAQRRLQSIFESFVTTLAH